MLERVKSLHGWSTHRYSELTTYVTALTCLVLFFNYPEFEKFYFEIISGGGADGKAALAFISIGLIATLGFILSLVHVFIKREKSIFEKTCMAVFTMCANGFAGIAAGIEIFPSEFSVLSLFPLWNIFMGVILLYQIGLMNFDVSDENAPLVDVIGASLILLIVFAIAMFQLKLTWAMTFSICISYASSAVYFVARMMSVFNVHSLLKD